MPCHCFAGGSSEADPNALTTSDSSLPADESQTRALIEVGRQRQGGIGGGSGDFNMVSGIDCFGCAEGAD